MEKLTETSDIIRELFRVYPRPWKAFEEPVWGHEVFIKDADNCKILTLNEDQVMRLSDAVAIVSIINRYQEAEQLDSTTR